MALKLYKKKRDFKKTAEPKGKRKTSLTKNLYIIQKHAASHLHYDFRIELNGVLLSWAVPKGPSLDPNVKRLAVHVEDHPLDYGSFEGIIPKGHYGGGTVMLWDKGIWQCEDKNPALAYQKGSLTFSLKAKKLNGRWKLFRMHGDDKTWLLIKLDDDEARSSKSYDITLDKPNSVVSKKSIEEISRQHGQPTLAPPNSLPQAKFPKSLHPQLATLVDKPPVGKQWVHEIKFDGYRLIAFKEGKKVTLMTRNQHDWTHKFKQLAQAISKLPIANLVLDGEVVVLDDKQHSNFQLLQNALRDKKSNYVYYLFDLLFIEKYNLMELPLLERKRLLENIIQNQHSDLLRYSDHASGSGKDILAQSCKLGLEGIISKDVNSPYSETRTRHWLKTKCIKRQEFVIGGYLPSTKRANFRSLMLGTFNDQHELIYNGNVGTGFTPASLKSIQEKLQKYVVKKMPYAKRPPASKTAVWVKPVLVAEIEYTEMTDAGSLRHPSFKGLRSDKPAKNIKLEVETPVTDITLTHPDKKLYPESNITKQDIADYYAEIQDWILPYIINRPLTLVRCPSDYQKCFYQKHISGEVPPGIFEIAIQGKEAKEEYVYIKDATGLLALPQLSVLELHPWSSQIKNLECPDIITFDLDPDPDLPWKKVVAGAFDVKETLEQIGLTSFIKTTGGKGLHVVVPIKPEHDWDTIKNFSHLLVDYLVGNNPTAYVGKMTKALRKNKIFIDYLRNQRGATAIAPYSTRARKGAPVATPIAWDELTNKQRDTQFTIKDIPERLATLKSDPWKDFFKLKQKLNLKKFK